MSHPLPATQKFIPATMTLPGALEALRAAEPGIRWYISGTMIVGNIGLHTFWLVKGVGMWMAHLTLQGCDVWGFETIETLADIASECALSAVEALSERIHNNVAHAA
jgi:hypothetical protein